MKYKLNFSTQAHQFYMSDGASLKETNKNDFWTDEANQSRLAIGDGILGIGLECYGLFKGELTILPESKKNSTEFNHYDHIVEGGISIESGLLQVLDCPNFNVELEVAINPGKYRVRIYSSNLASVTDDSGDDFYTIEMWPEINDERIVLKQYIPNKQT